MILSKRLQAIADLVSPGFVVADIGTDHALLPVFLVEQGKNPAAIAMDVKKGPLSRAEETIAAAGLEGKIQVRLSDGFAALRPDEAQSAVIAGMGGDLMIRILKQGADAAAGLEEIICSPQSRIARVRAFAREQGFGIDAEDMVREDGKYYQMFRLRPVSPEGRGTGPADLPAGEEPGGPGQAQGMREAQEKREMQDVMDYYGELLLRSGHPVLLDYLKRERQVKERILAQLAGGGSAARARQAEVSADLKRNGRAMALMGADPAGF